MALATLSILLFTISARRRLFEPGYVAGALLVGASLCQLYTWGFRQPQLFVLPAGLYLLVLAAMMRRFQGQGRISQLTEAGATVLLLGVTFGQALRADPADGTLYTLWLCVEALLLLGYGVLARLRVPFLGGGAFFIGGVLWFAVGPLLAMNQWVVIGCLGLLMVGGYVLLERRHEQLVRAGRRLVEQVEAWA
jgi:hypothetical protein